MKTSSRTYPNQEPLPFSDVSKLCIEKLGVRAAEPVERSLYSLSRGFEPLLMALLDRAFVARVTMTELMDFCKKEIHDVLLEDFDLPGERIRIFLKFLLVTDSLPLAFIKRNNLLNSSYKALLGYSDHWIAVKEGEISLTNSRWIGLLIDHFPVALPSDLTDELISELQTKGRNISALELALITDRNYLAENLLEYCSGDLLHQLDLPELKSLILRLEKRIAISNPRLLLDCTRCFFMTGDINSAGHYFGRLMQWLESQCEFSWLTVIPEHDRHAFKAGLHLYANLIGISNKECWKRIESVQNSLPTGAMPLLQEAFNYSKKGEFDKLSLTLQSGYYRCEALQESSLYVVFSITYFWVLLLTCRTQEARVVLSNSKNHILNSAVSYPGAHEWLLVMDILDLRMRGDMKQMKNRLSSDFLKNSAKYDAIKKFYLTILLAEFSIISGKEEEAKEFIQQLIDMQNVTSILKTYWLPGIQELQLLYSGKFSKRRELSEKLNILEKSLTLESDLQSQNQAFQICKLRLHLKQKKSISSLLLKLETIYTQSSQWLRLRELEVVRSVSLLQLEQLDLAISMFSESITKLIYQDLLGVLIDPLMVWIDFLRLPQDFAGKRELITLVSKLDLGIDLAIKKEDQLPFFDLSNREHEVLHLLSRGLKNKDIADELNISVTTIRTHLQNVYGKLGVNSRSAALAVAYKMNLV